LRASRWIKPSKALFRKFKGAACATLKRFTRTERSFACLCYVSPCISQATRLLVLTCATAHCSFIRTKCALRTSYCSACCIVSCGVLNELAQTTRYGASGIA
jgi:hypothetical protein